MIIHGENHFNDYGYCTCECDHCWDEDEEKCVCPDCDGCDDHIDD